MSIKLPTNNFPQADLEASNKKPVYVATAVGFALATGSVLLRGIARHKSRADFAWDDYTIVFALVSLLPLDQTIITTPKPTNPNYVCRSAKVRPVLGSPLCAGRHHCPVRGQIRIGSASACCSSQDRPLPEGSYHCSADFHIFTLTSSRMQWVTLPCG